MTLTFLPDTEKIGDLYVILGISPDRMKEIAKVMNKAYEDYIYTEETPIGFKWSLDVEKVLAAANILSPTLEEWSFISLSVGVTIGERRGEHDTKRIPGED